MKLDHHGAKYDAAALEMTGVGAYLPNAEKVGKKDLVAAASNILGGCGLTKRRKIVFPARHANHLSFGRQAPPKHVHVAHLPLGSHASRVTNLQNRRLGTAGPRRGIAVRTWPSFAPLSPFVANHGLPRPLAADPGPRSLVTGPRGPQILYIAGATPLLRRPWVFAAAIHHTPLLCSSACSLARSKPSRSHLGPQSPTETRQ
jgi:hypothetical protein